MLFGDPHRTTSSIPTATTANATAIRVGRLERLARKVAAATQPGQAPTVRLGPGIDRAEARIYQPGDDVRHIDWASSARVNDVLVRDTLAEHERVVLVVADSAASMQFGTSGMSKYDTGVVLGLAVAAVAVRSGERAQAVRVGGVVGVTPVTGGAQAVHQLARFLAPAPTTPALPLSDGLRAAARGSSGKLVVVASDFATPGFEPMLRGLAQRHAVVAVRVTDRREHELSAVGTVTFSTPNGPRTVATDSASVRTKFAAHAQQVHAERRERVMRCGVPVVDVVATDALDYLVRAARQLVEVVR